MTDFPNPLLTGVRLSDMTERRFSFGEIAEEIGGEADTLRSWFLNGGLALAPPLDEVAEKGGRSHRLHWRTAVLLLMALKLNDLGFAKKTGEAAAVAGGAFRAGLMIDHFETTASPLIAITREADGSPRVFLVARDAQSGDIEGPTSLAGFEGIGTILLDPIGFGRIVWRMGWRQVMAEAAAEGLAMTFSPEEIEAAEDAMRAEAAGIAKEQAGLAAGGFYVGDTWVVGENSGETVVPRETTILGDIMDAARDAAEDLKGKA